MPFTPNLMQLVLGRLVKWGGELIMVTPGLLDQNWFPEILRLATEPSRSFQSFKWFLWNAAVSEPIPKVMRDIKLISWKLSSKSAPGMELQKKLQEKLQAPGPRVPERTTNECLITGVLSTVRKSPPDLKLV